MTDREFIIKYYDDKLLPFRWVPRYNENSISYTDRAKAERYEIGEKKVYHLNFNLRTNRWERDITYDIIALREQIEKSRNYGQRKE